MDTNERHPEKEFSVEKSEEFEKHYSESGFWKVLGKAGQKVVEKALLLYYIMKSPKTPTRSKTIILGALGYLILPIDLIPDAIPILGFSDDLTALIAAIAAVEDCITPEIEEQAKNKAKEIL